MATYAKLGERQEKVIAALLAFPTVRLAAESVGIGESTVTRWLAEPEFKARYEAARREVVEGAKQALRSASLGAVSTLAAISSDPNAKESARVTAAKSILDLVLRIEEGDLAARIERLEQAVAHAE